MHFVRRCCPHRFELSSVGVTPSKAGTSASACERYSRNYEFLLTGVLGQRAMTRDLFGREKMYPTLRPLPPSGAVIFSMGLPKKSFCLPVCGIDLPTGPFGFGRFLLYVCVFT